MNTLQLAPPRKAPLSFALEAQCRLPRGHTGLSLRPGQWPKFMRTMKIQLDSQLPSNSSCHYSDDVD